MSEAEAQAEPEKGERIAKRIARAGVCSRRDAERLIAEGRVTLGGNRVTDPATRVDAEDVVAVDGNPIAAPERTRLWRYHKPAGLICTNKDPQGRRSIFDALPQTMPRVVSIGRLDLTSEGLILLTNDGGLARRLELPATGWTRRYRVRAFGTITPEAIETLARGLTVDGINYGQIQLGIDRVQGANTWMTVALKEGKYREVRKVLEHLGLRVNRLIRTAYGPFQLGGLQPGEVDEIPGKVLAEQLGRGAPGGKTSSAKGSWAKSADAHRRR